jgi:hypothetical protein
MRQIMAFIIIKLEVITMPRNQICSKNAVVVVAVAEGALVSRIWMTGASG